MVPLLDLSKLETLSVDTGKERKVTESGTAQSTVTL